MPESWICGGCGEETSVTHWRYGADGAGFHAGSDAPPSDNSVLPADSARKD